jgi:hypothetical protein
MRSRKIIQDELRNLESSLPVNDDQPFSVPEGYFEELPAVILAKVKSGGSSVQNELEGLSSLLASIPKTMPYSVPPAFFEESLDTAFVNGDETESSLLFTIGKKLPYRVPAGYFETFSKHVLAKVTEPKGKVVSLFARTWMRAATAAVIAGALLVSGMQLFGDKPESDKIVKGPQKVNETVVAQNNLAIDQEIKRVSTKELEQFIENIPAIVPPASNEENAPSEEGAQKLLKDVSVNEMESFLSALPASDDELSVTD